MKSHTDKDGEIIGNSPVEGSPEAEASEGVRSSEVQEAETAGSEGGTGSETVAASGTDSVTDTTSGGDADGAKTREKQCILCGRCLGVCPIVAATGREELGPRTKHFLKLHLEEGDESLTAADVRDLAKLCVSCGRCSSVCPYGLSGADSAADLRAAHPEFEQWLWKTWISRGRVLWPALATLARMNPPGVPAKYRDRLEAMKSMTCEPDEPWLEIVRYDTSHRGERAVLFPGCTASRLHPQWNVAAKALMLGLGLRMDATTPGWACCGSTLGHAGMPDAARKMQEINVREWRRAGRPLIVTHCATCRYGLAAYADMDLGWADGEAEEWRRAVTPLAALMGETELAFLDDAPSNVIFHQPCHADAEGEDLAFVRRAVGERLSRWTNDKCCGMGGITQLGAPELSARVASDCWSWFGPQPEGTRLLTACSGCVLQLTATAPAQVRVSHWLDAIAL